MIKAEGVVEWARRSVNQEMYAYFRAFTVLGMYQWSRQFEYPWVMANGRFRTNELVLDAGGGNGLCLMQHFLADRGCHVVNLDNDVTQLDAKDPRVLYFVGDIHNTPFLNGSFSRVICVSVLEHLDDPKKALAELWRVLAPGGRLLVTMDVADKMMGGNTPDMNHGITEDVARELVGLFGFEVPHPPTDITTVTLGEGNEKLQLRSLCFYVDKPLNISGGV